MSVDAERLRALDPAGRRALLLAESGLPGPRANLPLARAIATVVRQEEALALAADADEYLALCGAVALGAHAANPVVVAALRDLATDARWRVREGVAMGLQVLGADDTAAMRAVIDGWRDDPHPLVQRARAAAICEPPLLKDPVLVVYALTCCAEATAVLRAVPPEARRRDDVRTLRQALGYCWSVAIAADPQAGLPAFAALARDLDPDVAWVVRANRAKARLARLL